MFYPRLRGRRVAAGLHEFARIVEYVHTHLIAHGGVMVLSEFCWSSPACGSSGLNLRVPGLTAIMAPSAPFNIPMFSPIPWRQTAQIDSSV